MEVWINKQIHGKMNRWVDQQISHKIQYIPHKNDNIHTSTSNTI